jgi:hypothetical protein
MIKKMIFNILINLKRNFIECLKPSDFKNHDGKSFTRKRVLTIERMILIILRNNPMSLQVRLDDFFEETEHEEETVSKQAFSEARAKLDPEIVKSSFELTARTLASCDDLELWKDKYRLCAIDGSDIALENAVPIIEHFGCSGSKKNAATAMASLCFDALNNIIYDAGLYPYTQSEREAARVHIPAVQALPRPAGSQNLFIFDRGYPSHGLFAEFIDTGVSFLMRVRKNLNHEFDLVNKDKEVAFTYKGKEYQVRIFNLTLEGGEKEVLVTNLSGEDLKYDEAAELYFKRWCIELKFRSLKSKLELENMSGRRPITVYQDFWAKMDMANTFAALEFATNDAIEDNTADHDNKYEKTTNESRLVSKLSKRYLELMCEADANKRMELFDILVKDIAQRPEDVKPGRKSKRKIPRKRKFCDRYKRALR